MGAELLRRWVAQADVDAGDRDGVTGGRAVIRQFKAENKHLREDGEIGDDFLVGVRSVTSASIDRAMP